MVKETDFRLSNLVEYNGMVMGVSGISSPKPYKDEKYAHKYIFELFDGAGLINCTLDEIKPIPLTEEWLIKFGFKTSEKQWNTFSRSHYYLCEKDELCFKLHETKNIFYMHKYEHIKFVHQLQNLYFALIDKELTLK